MSLTFRVLSDLLSQNAFPTSECLKELSDITECVSDISESTVKSIQSLSDVSETLSVMSESVSSSEWLLSAFRQVSDVGKFVAMSLFHD